MDEAVLQNLQQHFLVCSKAVSLRISGLSFEGVLQISPVYRVKESPLRLAA